MKYNSVWGQYHFPRLLDSHQALCNSGTWPASANIDNAHPVPSPHHHKWKDHGFQMHFVLPPNISATRQQLNGLLHFWSLGWNMYKRTKGECRFCAAIKLSTKPVWAESLADGSPKVSKLQTLFRLQAPSCCLFICGMAFRNVNSECLARKLLGLAGSMAKSKRALWFERSYFFGKSDVRWTTYQQHMLVVSVMVGLTGAQAFRPRNCWTNWWAEIKWNWESAASPLGCPNFRLHKNMWVAASRLKHYAFFKHPHAGFIVPRYPRCQKESQQQGTRRLETQKAETQSITFTLPLCVET